MTTPKFTIRQATETDADRIAETHIDSIHTLGAEVYPPEIIAEWGAPRDGERYKLAMGNGETFFVAEAGEKLLGFSSYRLEDGKHRTAIYVRGDAARMGVGSALFHAAEAAARDNGAAEIHLSSSLGAVGFYEHMGFEQLETGRHRLRTGGLMDCVFMRKRLAAHDQPAL